MKWWTGKSPLFILTLLWKLRKFGSLSLRHCCIVLVILWLQTFSRHQTTSLWCCNRCTSRFNTRGNWPSAIPLAESRYDVSVPVLLVPWQYGWIYCSERRCQRTFTTDCFTKIVSHTFSDGAHIVFTWNICYVCESDTLCSNHALNLCDREEYFK